jgi:ABC-type sugar transport system ATPase subunit
VSACLIIFIGEKPMDLWNELSEKRALLDKAIDTLASNGYDLAAKERDYKIAINKKALELRAEDTPVTLINTIIYGYEDIAKLRFDRDTAQVKYNANNEYINTLKLQIRILENQLGREYSNTR